MSATLTTHDLAKYPFLPQAQNYIKQLNLTIQELTETPQIIKHAEHRVTQSFQPTALSARKTPEIEIASFPVATMMVAAINDNYLRKRFALHEAKRMYEHLKLEQPRTILEIAQLFQWDIQTTPHTIVYPYTLHFTHYLRNTTSLQHAQWKLINRQLDHGHVPITHHEATRLLQEEIRKHIEAKLNTKVTHLPPEIQSTVERLKNQFTAQKPTLQHEDIPQTVNVDAFPPCIKTLYDNLSTGHHLSHIGRFTLTTFLVNIGMPTDAILDLYRNLTDFNERLTRYQVEHIAGERGSRTRYKPPRCATLRTHGVCISPDETCRKAWHPLRYYKRKLKQEPHR
jgi:DNA primase large subunit